MIQFAKPDISGSEAFAAKETLLGGMLTGGPVVPAFEKKIAEITGADHVVCYDSCTAALESALRILGIGPGDEVITTPFTYTATADVIRNVGASIIFCDLKSDSFEMDYQKMVELITPRTKAVIPVDYGGVPCDYPQLSRLLMEKADLFVPANPIQASIGQPAIIADAAHSFGASLAGNSVGILADFTCFSFHAIKNVTTGGEGGALVWVDFDEINNADLERTLHLIGDHGQTAKNISGVHGREWEYDIELFGQNHIMTDVDAAVGIEQINRLGLLDVNRRYITELYEYMLPKTCVPALDHRSHWHKSAMHLFPIRITGADEDKRNAVFASMLDAGIHCNVHYKPLPMFTAYRQAGFSIEDFPAAYEMYANLITLPYHTFLTTDDVETVCKTLGKAVEGL